MKALFVYTTEERCGVWQYGRNLYECLLPHSELAWAAIRVDNLDTLRKALEIWPADVIVYNWQRNIGGVLGGAPFMDMPKQVLVYHDCAIRESGWAAILFSDPTMKQRDNWFPIGRPLPAPAATGDLPEIPTIGVHGFVGAQANIVLGQVLKEFEHAKVRLHLPLSPFVDDHGNIAGAMIGQCKEMVKGTGVTLEVTTEFKPPNELLLWLASNTINCYFRDPAHPWTGIASAPDYALAARRPLAINQSSAFRHLHGLEPSIQIEHHSITEIISHGLTPLVPLYEKWSPQNIAKQVDSVLLAL